MAIDDEAIRQRLLAMEPVEQGAGWRRPHCKVVLRDSVEAKARGEFDGWVMAHRGRVYPYGAPDVVYYEIQIVELAAEAESSAS